MTDAIAVPRQRAATRMTPVGSLRVLLRADFSVQLRSYRSLILTFLLPLIILIVTSRNGKGAARLGGSAILVALALTLGLVSIGAVGYALNIARDRDRGVLQRLRVTPAPTWAIMGSRWIVQVASAVAMSIVVFIVAGVVDNITLSFAQYALTLIVTVLGSAIFLSIGQAIAGLIASADTLNAAGRLIYVPLVGLSLFGHSDLFGTTFELISRWSPGGCLENILSVALGASSWTGESWGALAAGVGYTVVFAAIGIRWFRWVGR